MTVITITLLGFISITAVVWYYLRFISPYLKLPSSCATLVDCILLCINSLLRRGYAQKNVLQKAKEMCRNYKKEGLFVAWLNQPTVIVFGPEQVKQILNDQAATYKPNIYNVFKYFLRNSIFLSDGERWKREKKIVKQAFQFALKRKKIKIMNRHSENLVKTLSSLPNNTCNEILDILKHSTLQIIIESSFGCAKNFTDRSLMIESLEKISTFVVERFFKPWLYPDFLLDIFPEGRKCLKVFKKFKGMLLEMVETLKENMLTSNRNLIDMKPELVGEVLLKEHLKDPSFTMDELMLDQIFLVFAAFDTTAKTLKWCLHLLGLHEEVQKRILLEVEEFNEDLCDKDLHKMEYTECVIRETLRMYTTVPIVFRYLTKEIQCGKYTIPKGSPIAVLLYMLHKNSDMFPDPEKFVPERFMQLKNGDPRQLYTAFFSEGLRPCVGKVDALNTLKIMIAYIVRNFKVISLDNPKDDEVLFAITTNPLKPLRMQFIPRREIKDDDIFSTAKM